MTDNKTYYYMRLKDNFFDSDEMIVLESMTDGYIYSNILLKLYLRSLKNDGRLMFNDTIPFNSNMLATISRHPVGVIEKAVSIFKELGLIEMLDSGAIYMLNIQLYIGKTSTEADRQKEYRARIAAEKNKLLTSDVTNVTTNVEQKYTRDRDRDRDRDKDKEIDKEQDTDTLFDNYFQIFSNFTKGIKSQPRVDAMHAFAELSPEQRDKALIGADNYVTWYQNSGNDIQYSKNASVFLKDLIFVDYQEMPEDKSGYDPELGF